LIGSKRLNLIVGWCGQFLFFVVSRQFSQVVGEWPENQILIPDWAYFHCPGTTLFINPHFLHDLSVPNNQPRDDWIIFRTEVRYGNGSLLTNWKNTSGCNNQQRGQDKVKLQPRSHPVGQWSCISEPIMTSGYDIRCVSGYKL